MLELALDRDREELLADPVHVPDDDPARMHSLGMGFTVADGVTVTVSRAPVTRTEFNGETFDFATVRDVAATVMQHFGLDLAPLQGDSAPLPFEPQR